METTRNGKTKLPQHTNGSTSAFSYDDGTETSSGERFPFSTAFVDAVGSTATAVVAAGDMFMMTRDRGGYAVHIVIRSADGNFDQWYDNEAKAVYRLDKLYDSAVSKRNHREPPRLPGA